MFPSRDQYPSLRPPIVTKALIVINVLVWLFFQGGGSGIGYFESLCDWSLIPGHLFGQVPPGTELPLAPNIVCVLDPDRPTWATLFTHMFMHGSWFHLIANMWFLWVFGDNVEDALGHLRFLLFYLTSGLAAAFAQIFAEPGAAAPMVGASGAISGVMGAYAWLYPSVLIEVIVPLGLLPVSAFVPAFYMLFYWFAIQVISGLLAPEGAGGVAWWAHAGGFIAGWFLVRYFYRPDYLAEHMLQRPIFTRPAVPRE